MIQYFYDALGQVIRENNQRENITVIYDYDFGGNILSKKTYGYTTGSVDGLTPTDTDTYTYGNTNWKDQLTSFNGLTMTYDEIGNIKTYNGSTFNWDKGRQLSSITSGGPTISYTYNDSGIRTSKTVGSTTTSYHLNGDKVTYEKTGNVYSYYTYDSNGQLISINYNGTEYTYIRNGQNDIIGLVDSAGTIVVNYTYSTYGEIVSTTGSLASTLGIANPYRYRGYRFDTETGYYYLQSRYYDPQIGRFINADDAVDTNKISLGANGYAYAYNNPLNIADYEGRSGTAILLLFGSAFSFSFLVPVIVFGLIALNVFLIYKIYEKVKNSKVNAHKPSDDVDWTKGDKNHIINGTKGNHINGWKQFRIDPNGRDAWIKLLALFQKVVNSGQTTGDKIMDDGSKFVYYYKYFAEQDITVWVKIWESVDGIRRLSDAYPGILK